jgi:hypothetical protein
MFLLLLFQHIKLVDPSPAMGTPFESDPPHYINAGTTGTDCIGGCKLDSLCLSTRETMYMPFP